MNLVTALLIFLSGLCGSYSLLPQKFYYVSKTLTWDQAQSYCQTNYNDLAFVYSEADLEKLKASLPYRVASSAWIGGFDLISDSENTTGSDNTTTSSTNCPGIDTISWKQIKQATMNCQEHYPFYCSQFEGKRVLMRMKLTSMDPNDPVMKANILAKINEKFNKLGFGDAVTIQWFTKRESLAKEEQNNTCNQDNP